MVKSENLYLHSLKAISPIDGRHRIMTEPLSEWFSEFAYHKYRIYMEIEYLIALSELKDFTALRNFSEEEKQFLRDTVNNFSLKDAQIIQNIDQFGYQEIKPTNHDFKACEYFLKIKMQESSLSDVIEFVHFGLTAEDANNISYSCKIRGALEFHYVPALVNLLDTISQFAEKEKNTAMLSKTHGQPATPTTFGKEIANYLERLRKELVFLATLKLPAKVNGAVGNHAAQHFAAPEVDWINFTKDFVTELGFEPNLFTTQMESHDGYTRLFSCLISINNILRDLAIDFWLYISQGYLTQKKLAHEIGSSTMPHKINPWRMEVAEGQTVEANYKLMGFIQKLQVSRLQRDLSDHEAERAIGVGFAHSYLAVVHVAQELERLSVNKQEMADSLTNFGSILTEAVQTLLRKEGYEKPYELLKEFSRGKHSTVSELHQFVDSMNIREETKIKIKSLRPQDYIGLSSELTDLAIRNWKDFKKNYATITNNPENKKNPLVVAILGGQWGDEGKGKVVDLIANNFDVAARATGGNNAGHTVLIKDEKHIFHLLPSAITWSDVNCVLGNGMVIDPLVLLKEINTLKKRGYQVNNLSISGRAHVILLYHNMLDYYQEQQKGDKKVGTTNRGIGPGYADKIHRTGVRINDLLNKELLAEKIKFHLQEKFGTFKHLHKKEEQEILNKLKQVISEEEFFREYKEKLSTIASFDIQKMTEVLTEIYLSVGQKLKPLITETGLKLERAYNANKNILLEGAQGVLLDIDHGTYPFVTSSNPSVGGFKTGLGFPHIGQTYSIIKAYTTRVGGGPFPTELGTEEETKQEGKWDGIKNDFETHLETSSIRANIGEEYHIGKYMRLSGREYGSTTGRPRRCGWHDALLTKHTSRINGPKIIITKLDVLSGLKKIKICTTYKYIGLRKNYDGEDYIYGKILNEFPADGHLLQHCQPHDWIELDGWNDDLTQVRNYEDLPENAKKYLEKIEELGNVEVCLISVGPERNQTIVIPERWPFKMNTENEGTKVETRIKETNSFSRKYKAIIYDLDNTLIDSNGFTIDLIKETAKTVSTTFPFRMPTDDEIKEVQKKNLPFEEIFVNLFPNTENYNNNEPLWKIILAKYREKAKTLPYKDTENGSQTVKELQERGFVQGIVTNRVKMASVRLEQAGYPEMAFLVAPESKEFSKPNPKSLHTAIKTLAEKGINTEEIISIGDHPHDYLASKGAGLDFVAILTGSTSKEEFIALGLSEDKIINDLSELKPLLEFN